jgi:hypothetical protein
MQEAVAARTPAHVWIVGILSLLWNAFGCLDYTMTNLKNPSWMAMMTAEQIAYMDSLPGWLTAFWALGVWGGLAGSVLLLVRSRYAIWAFAISFIGAVVALGYQMFLTQMPASMKQGGNGVIPWVIILIAAFLLWYSWSAEKKGVLR